MSIVERYRKVRVPALSGLAEVRARLEAAERRRVARMAQQVAAGQLLLHEPEVRLAMGPEQEAEAYARLNDLEATIGLPPTAYVDVPKQEFAKQIHAGQVTVAERARPAGEREALLDDLADATMARFGVARVARYMVDLRNQQTLARAAMSQGQGKSEPEATESPMEARQWVRSLIEPYAPAAVEEEVVPGRQPATRTAVPATGAKAGPLAGYEWREPVTPGGPATAAPPSTETPARPTAPPAAPAEAPQPEGEAGRTPHHRLPEPMTVTEPAAPEVAPKVSGPAISALRPPAFFFRGKEVQLPKKEVLAIFEEACKKHEVPLDLALAVGCQESGFDQSLTSRAGATGVMQLMPKTAEGLGVDRYKERENIFGGVRLLAQELAVWPDIDHALAAYNWGRTNLRRHLRKGKDLDSAPPETRKYVPSVKQLRGQFGALLAWAQEHR